MTAFFWCIAIAVVVWVGSILALLSIAFWETLSERRRKGAVSEPDLIHPSAGRFGPRMVGGRLKQDSAA